MMASVLQLSENLTEGQAAEAVRDRTTWKSALGLEARIRRDYACQRIRMHEVDLLISVLEFGRGPLRSLPVWVRQFNALQFPHPGR
jgi:hypothetical protein